MRNKKLYPKEWVDTIRPAALQAAGYKCAICKVKQRAVGYYDYKREFVECDEYMQRWAEANNFKLVTIHLQVHHRDGDRSNNEMSNLQVLCPRHHFKTEKELNKLKRLTSGIIFKQKPHR